MIKGFTAHQINYRVYRESPLAVVPPYLPTVMRPVRKWLFLLILCIKVGVADLEIQFPEGAVSELPFDSFARGSTDILEPAGCVDNKVLESAVEISATKRKGSENRLLDTYFKAADFFRFEFGISPYGIIQFLKARSPKSLCPTCLKAGFGSITTQGPTEAGTPDFPVG